MNTIYNQLKESPLLYLSGGSKELFHSNFLYWLGAGNELPRLIPTVNDQNVLYQCSVARGLDD